MLELLATMIMVGVPVLIVLAQTAVLAWAAFRHRPRLPRPAAAQAALVVGLEAGSILASIAIVAALPAEVVLGMPWSDTAGWDGLLYDAAAFLVLQMLVFGGALALAHRLGRPAPAQRA